MRSDIKQIKADHSIEKISLVAGQIEIFRSSGIVREHARANLRFWPEFQHWSDGSLVAANAQFSRDSGTEG